MAKLEKYLWSARTSLSGQLVYLWDLAGRSLFFVIVLLVFNQLWQATLTHEVAGLTRSQLIWYLVFTEIIMLSTPSGAALGVDEEIKSGSIAYLLIRPFNYPLFMFSRYWGESLARILINTCLGSATALVLVGLPKFAPAAIPAFIISLFMAVSLKFFLSMLISLSAFWVEESTPFHWIYGKFLFTVGGLFVPLEFFPGWLESIARALPFNLILYAPARLLVDWQSAFFLNSLLRQTLWLAGAILVTQYVFSRGVKKLNVHGG